MGLSGRTMARTGLRMMPTFPSSPLRFRTAGFPRYGSKAGLSDGAFRPMPDHRIVSFASVVRASRGRPVLLAQSRGRQLGETPPCEQPSPLYPRGPRSGPGYAVPVHPRLSAPSAPLASTSRFHRSAAYTPCLRCAFRPRRPTRGSALSHGFLRDLSSSQTPGSLLKFRSQSSLQSSGLRPIPTGSALPIPSPSASGEESLSGLPWFAPLRPAPSLASLADQTGLSPSPRDFYFRASDGSVALPVAGYNYGGVWALSTGGTFTRWKPRSASLHWDSGFRICRPTVCLDFRRSMNKGG